MRGKLPLLQMRLINLEQFDFFNASEYENKKNIPKKLSVPLVVGTDALVKNCK